MPAAVPFMPAMPSQRTDVSPLGGRAGAAPAFSLEDWAPPPPSSESVQPLRAAPHGVERESDRDRDRERERGGGAPAWGVMFVVACGFAFLMSVLTILGARWLSRSEQQAAAAPAVTVVNQQPAATAGPQDPEPSEMVIELDDIGLEGDPNAKTKKPAASTTTNPNDKQASAHPASAQCSSACARH